MANHASARAPRSFMIATRRKSRSTRSNGYLFDRPRDLRRIDDAGNMRRFYLRRAARFVWSRVARAAMGLHRKSLWQVRLIPYPTPAAGGGGSEKAAHRQRTQGLQVTASCKKVVGPSCLFSG